MIILSTGFAQNLEVIQLKYRSADQVIPILQPFVEKGGVISGTGNQLILRTSSVNLSQLKQVLESIDRLPRSLMISVRQDADGSQLNKEAEVSGNLHKGDIRANISSSGNSKNGLTIEAGRGAIRGRIYETQSGSDNRLNQQVQVLEGNRAFIQVGQSVPVPNQIITQTPHGTVVTQARTDYRDITSGFYVLPRLAGDIVTLEISQQNNTPIYEGSSSAHVQNLATTVSGRLGEWIELGGIGRNSTERRSSYLSHATGTKKDQRRLWLKIEEVK